MFLQSFQLVVKRIFVVTALISLSSGAAWAGRYKVLYTFGRLASIPSSGLVVDGAGNAYGTTAEGGYNNAGAVYQLSPTKGYHIIYAFSGHPDGKHPQGNLAIDSSGNLYGTTIDGGAFTKCDHGLGCGTLFRLTPPPNGQGRWTETILYNFSGGDDGAGPQAGVILDEAGNLYGTTAFGAQTNQACQTGCGTVFDLTPSESRWTLSVLHTFSGDYFSDGGVPRGGVVLDVAGNLYGTTSLGTVFQMSPVLGGQWSFETIHRFSNTDGGAPFAGLTLDESGNLYGTTSGGGKFSFGNVFELSPGDNGWADTVIHDFAGGSDGANPQASLVFDPAGNLYGTTSQGGGKGNGGGTVFKLVPMGSGQWAEYLFRFASKPDQGAMPTAPVLLDSVGKVYGTASSSPGVIYRITQ